MKVRIAGNKIRFRLKEPEVEHFERTGNISEALEFGHGDGQQLRFTLNSSTIDKIAIEFRSNEVVVLLPGPQAQEWTGTGRVGIEAVADTGSGKKISVLIEKDFMCMDGREEENVGSYPNPKAM